MARPCSQCSRVTCLSLLYLDLGGAGSLSDLNLVPLRWDGSPGRTTRSRRLQSVNRGRIRATVFRVSGVLVNCASQVPCVGMASSAQPDQPSASGLRPSCARMPWPAASGFSPRRRHWPEIGRSAWPRSLPRQESAARRCTATSPLAGAQQAPLNRHPMSRPRAASPPIGTSPRCPFRRRVSSGGRPLALEVTRVLDEVPPHLVPDQLVAEARRAAGVPSRCTSSTSTARSCCGSPGSEEFPDQLDDAARARARRSSPKDSRASTSGSQQPASRLRRRAAVAAGPRDRAAALHRHARSAPLADVAKQGAAALELANDYTDFIEAARRHKPTTPAAEIQQNLFPPRIARIAGAQLAGGLLPELRGRRRLVRLRREPRRRVAGDRRRRRQGSHRRRARRRRARRATRRAAGGTDLEQALLAMHETVRQLEQRRLPRHGAVARWHAATATLTGSTAASRRHIWSIPTAPCVAWRARCTRRWAPATSSPLHGQRARLRPGERLMLLTDGIIERHMEGGGTFGVDGLAKRSSGRRRDGGRDRHGHPARGHRLLEGAAGGRCDSCRDGRGLRGRVNCTTGLDRRWR